MSIFKKKKNLVNGVIVYLFSNILNAAIPFLLLPILTRVLTYEEYGEVAMFQTWLGALTAFVGISLHGATTRKYFDGVIEESELREFIGSCLQILLVTTLFTFAIVLSIKENLSLWLGLGEKWLLFGVWVTSCSVVLQIRLGQWQVRKQAIKYGLLQVGQSLTDIFLSLLLVVFLLKGSDGRMSAQVLTVTSFAVGALILLNRDKLLVFFHWRPLYIKEALRFGIPLIPHVAGAYLLLSIDRFVINDKLGLAEVGIYMVAVQFGMAISLAFDAVNKAYVPWLFERLKLEDMREKKKIVKFTYIWYLLIIIGVFFAFIIGPWLITFVAGEKYAKAGEVFGWIALGQGFKGMYLMKTNYIFYSKRTGVLSTVTLTTGIINIILMYFLVDKYGLQGAAYAFSFSMGLFFIFSAIAANKVYPMPWFSFRR